MNSNYHVACAFAKHKASRSRHMYSDGSHVYSYGSHFCIAQWIGDQAFCTWRTYSPSTAKHVSHVRWALKDANPIMCYDPAASIECNLEMYDAKIQEYKDLLSRARKESTRNRYMAAMLLVEEYKDRYQYHMGGSDSLKMFFDK